ncbi:MAG: hypothetical protein H0X24_01180 [Ktedonobacterales bacterium]|nr:hypothetical protein [Ktedonobacterales bacterium]
MVRSVSVPPIVPATRLTLEHLLAEQTIRGALLCSTTGEWYWYRHEPTSGHQSYQEHLKAISVAVLREAMLEEPQDSGWMPSGLARFGSQGDTSWFVRWLPPSRVELLLELDAHTPPKVFTVPLPGLVVCGAGRRYAVWAITASLFAPAARAYHAPLPNLGLDGEICYGSVTVPSVAWDTIERSWQQFITSPFNDHLVQNRSKAYPTDIRRHLVHLAKRRAARYPVSDLRPLGVPRHPVTIAEAVAQFIHHR